MSKTYTTWQVMRLLERHQDWVAEAPETSEFFGMTMRFADGAHTIIFPNDSVLYHPRCQQFDCRSDWTIKRPKKKRIVKKADCRITGAEAFQCVSTLYDGRIQDYRVGCLDPSKTYRLLLVEVDE